jgi:tetratricopeptide (TPR) repeat protein
MGAATSVALQSPIADTQGSRARWCHLASLLLFIAAMLSKASVVMFPCVLLLHAWWRRGRVGRRDLVASVPFFAVSATLGVVTILFQQHRAIENVAVRIGGLLPHLAVAGSAAAFYAMKFLAPVGLLPMYPRWTVDPAPPLLLLPWVAVAGLAWFLARTRTQRGRTIGLGLGFFLLNLVPVMGFVPMAYMRLAWVADHLAYLPMVGLAGLAAAAAGTMLRPQPGTLPAPGRRAAVFICLGGVVSAAAALAHGYAKRFESEETLWSYAISRNPNAWLGYNNLGMAQRAEGKREEAFENFETAVRLSPTFAEAQNNLGAALMEQGRLKEAQEHYETAIRLKPDLADAYNNEANLLLQTGDIPGAVSRLRKALSIDPDHAEAHNNLGNALLRSGDAAGAIAQYREALRLKPDFPEAHSNYGAALASVGKDAEAAEQYEEALRLKPGFPAARQNLDLLKRKIAPPAGRP